MQDWLIAQAKVSPEKEAINGLDYSEYSWHTLKTAGYLAGEGVQHGDRVAILLANDHVYAIVIHALRLLGAVAVPLNVRLTSDELSWQIDNTQCAYLLCARTTAGLADMLSIGGCQMVSVDHDTSFPCIFRDANAHGLDHIDSLADGNVDLDKVFAIIHTSGTSGQPKGVVLTYGNIFYSAMASAYRLGHQPDDRWLCVLPLYHVGGLSIILRAVLYGITVDLHPRFDLDAINHALDTQPITLISLVPTMLYRLLESRTHWPVSLRLILLGGAAASPELLARCQAIGLPLATTYGLTEVASQVATMLPEDVTRKLGSVGKPLLFMNVKIVDEQGEAAVSGEYGEVVVSGPTVMQGYYNNPTATTKTLRNSDLYTGDIGYLDNDGDLFIMQRRSDLIVSGGENVYPAEVEGVMRGHPAVKAAAVVGIPDAEWGHLVAAALVLNEESAITEDSLTDFCRERLAGYKLPRRVLLVDALPQTASGKIQRSAVVDLFADKA